jgi:hypothetical protein
VVPYPLHFILVDLHLENLVGACYLGISAREVHFVMW